MPPPTHRHTQPKVHPAWTVKKFLGLVTYSLTTHIWLPISVGGVTASSWYKCTSPYQAPPHRVIGLILITGIIGDD